MQQRYVVLAILFFSFALTYAFRTSFPLILTQMVYVPNSNTTNVNSTNIQPNEANSELICPTSHAMIHRETLQSVGLFVKRINRTRTRQEYNY